MAVHNWKRVRSGVFHDFHTAWIVELQRVLNQCVLPPDSYVMAELPIRALGSDAATVHRHGDSAHGISEADETLLYTAKQNTLVIRHSRGDRVVAMIEIISPGNKQSREEVDRFVHKAFSALHGGIHLLIIDLFPPGRNDPQGLHGALWSRLGEDEFLQRSDKPLTLAAYEAKRLPIAYVEPIAVGAELPEMPLFLTRGGYINVPLEATYRAAYEGVPERWRRVIEDR